MEEGIRIHVVVTFLSKSTDENKYTPNLFALLSFQGLLLRELQQVIIFSCFPLRFCIFDKFGAECD